MNIAVILFHLFGAPAGPSAHVSQNSNFRNSWNDAGCDVGISTGMPTTVPGLEVSPRFYQFRFEARCNKPF